MVFLGRDVSRKSARIGARTIGGMAGGTLLVTTLVIVFVQDLRMVRAAVRRAHLAEHNAVTRENLQEVPGQGLPF